MKTMAEVIADVLAAHGNLEWSFEYGGFVCVECGWQETYARPYAQEAQTEARSNHQATALSTALSAAGYGPVNAVAVVHVAHDTEAHARSFNKGYETAMAQELADDPTTAQDWLDAKLKAAGAQALRDAAEFADDPSPEDMDSYFIDQADVGRWLRARADDLDTP